MNVEALVRRLEDTHDEAQRLRGEVVEALKAFYGGASALSAEDALAIAGRWSAPSFPHAPSQSELEQRVQQLSQALAEVVGRVQLDQPPAPAGDAAPLWVASFAQRERLRRQIAQSTAMLGVVEKVTRLDNALAAADAQLDKDNVVGAAEAVAAAQELVDAIDDASVRDPATGSDHDDIRRLLSVQLLKKRTRLAHRLQLAHSQTLITKKVGALCLPSAQPSPATRLTTGSRLESIRALWNATAISDGMVSRLREIAAQVRHAIFEPLFADDTATVKISQESDGVLISICSGLAPKSEVDGLGRRCGMVIDVIELLHADLLGGDTALTSKFGEALWKSPGKLEHQLLSLIQDKIPREASSVGTYRDVVIAVAQELESRLSAIGFVIAKSSQLFDMAGQMHHMYAKHRRQQLLIKARTIMGRDYRNSVQVIGATERCNIDAAVGTGKKGASKGKNGSNGSLASQNVHGLTSDDVENGCFQMPDFVISRCAHDVVELVHQTLIEASSADAMRANTFFQTSRDILVLFRAVVPTLYREDIANDARSCMLYHNDCMYIAYHMLTIGHHYKNRFPPPLSQIATMVDMVPSFREAGESALISYSKALSEEMVAGVKSFKDNGGFGSGPAIAELDQSIRSTLYKLNQVHASWFGSLPSRIYNKVMGLIVQPLADTFLEAVLSEPTISASVAAQLHTLLSLLLESSNVFPSQSQPEKLVPTFSKLKALSSLLVQPLASVHDDYVNFKLVVFTTDELSSLIRALFRDSPERKSILRAMETR